MHIRFAGALASLALFVTVAATALAQSPNPKATLSPFPQGSEVAFLRGIQKDLNARFPTPKDAEAAGYIRYTNEDEDGAISYANLQWQSKDAAHPSQLWYDVHGHLLGADFSVLQSGAAEPPAMWGVDYHRWVSFREHVHYVMAGPNGNVYGATSVKKFTAAGGNVDKPSAATLVSMGVVKSPSEVKNVFLFPSIWDLIVWVKPNPNGAFADKNPLVIPSANAEKGDM